MIYLKLIFDKVFSFISIILLSPFLIIFFILASWSTKESGIFSQIRVGQKGKRFTVYKYRTMKTDNNFNTTVTQRGDKRITRFGKFLRKYKIDELPQLFNILKGEMSFVGPRPDVPGYADKLVGEDKIILTILPGITGPASLHFKHEEELLAKQHDPEKYNQEVIWPKKVQLNKQYIHNWSFQKDLYYIYKTLFS